MLVVDIDAAGATGTGSISAPRPIDSGWPADLPPADLASVNYSWGRIVGRLKDYAESGRPDPYFP
jgi:hypothetical protein